MEIPKFNQENIREVLDWVKSIRPEPDSPVIDQMTPRHNWLVANEQFEVTHFSLGLLIALVEHDLSETYPIVEYSAAKTIGLLMQNWGDSDDASERELANITVKYFSDHLGKVLEESERSHALELRKESSYYNLISPFLAFGFIGGEGRIAFSYYCNRLGDESLEVIDRLCIKYNFDRVSF